MNQQGWKLYCTLWTKWDVSLQEIMLKTRVYDQSLIKCSFDDSHNIRIEIRTPPPCYVCASLEEIEVTARKLGIERKKNHCYNHVYSHKPGLNRLGKTAVKWRMIELTENDRDRAPSRHFANGNGTT